MNANLRLVRETDIYSKPTGAWIYCQTFGGIIDRDVVVGKCRTSEAPDDSSVWYVRTGEDLALLRGYVGGKATIRINRKAF